MFDNDHLNEQAQIVTDYLRKEFKLDTDSMVDFDNYLDINLKNIISLKIWNRYIKENGLSLHGQDRYIDEIISNLNQSLILGAIGFKLPAYMLMRRSLENILSFFFYIDHPIEYLKKEKEPLKKNDGKIIDYKSYLKEYPYDIQYEETQAKAIKPLISKTIDLWTSQYRELSNYVHGTNSGYLELKNYLDNIHPSDENIVSIKEQVKVLGDNN